MFDKLTGLVTNNFEVAREMNSADSQIFLMLIMVFMVFIAILVVAVYVYTSLATMKIAQRTRTKPYWLAWIPCVGQPLVTAKIAKMHWWPMIMGIIGGFLLVLGYLFLVFGLAKVENSYIIFGLLSLLVGICLLIAFTVFNYIWYWKTFEAVGRPGWWPLLGLIPYAGGIIFLVLLGVAAWGKPEKR
ncbi:MAG: DUF805 domain-containing protein [Candidatus Pacearchaeota archaeon]|jgi:hypothetical protein